MPKDDWAKAKRKDAAKKAVADKKADLLYGRPFVPKQPKRLAGDWSPESKLWFEKYKDQVIKDIPTAYLAWLVKQPPKDDRTKSLQRYIQKNQDKWIKRHGYRHAVSKQLTNACNPNTKLWFGKYKDQAIKDIPRSYLSWLAQQSSQSWRIELVQTYLLNYLSLQSPL